jgi:hypothetical protein
VPQLQARPAAAHPPYARMHTTTSDGTFSGTIRKAIGAGYTPVDGYGFINAAGVTDMIFANGFD